MIVGIGIDQVEVERIRRLLERRPERAARRLFTERERSHCRERPDPPECFAARFAAKEAYLKALGTGWTGGLGWREMEVVTGPRGRPGLTLSGEADRRLRSAGGSTAHLSFTHEAGMAAAVVVIEG